MPLGPPTTQTSRQLILAAALLTFDTQGYGSATMSDIRREAGVSNGSLYHHFPSKEHLTAALFAEGVANYQAGFLAVLESVADVEAGVRGGVVFHMHWAEQNRPLARFLLHALGADVDTAPKPSPSGGKEFLRDVHGWLRDAVEAGAIIELPDELYYPIWIGPAQERTRQLLAGRVRLVNQEAERHLANEAWRSLRAGAS